MQSRAAVAALRLAGAPVQHAQHVHAVDHDPVALVETGDHGDHGYKEVRGLIRGLALIRALNRTPGGAASASELARVCGIHRTTAKRILETLRAEGLVRSGLRSGEYQLTRHVRQSSDGFRQHEWIDHVVTPLMQAAVRELLWPCDLATVEGGCMIVRESTHRFSMLSQHHDMVGEKMPVLHTALGRAWLAACSDEERAALLGFLARQAERLGVAPGDLAAVDRVVAETRERGFATNLGEWSREASFSAVAVPLVSANRVIGALNLVYPKDAVSLDEMATRYVPRLKALATRIGFNVALAGGQRGAQGYPEHVEPVEPAAA